MQSQPISPVFNHLNKDKHNAIWQNLLAVRKIMATENKSFNEAKKDLEEVCGEEIDLNLDTISVYYSLYALVCFKEDHEADMDFGFLETDKDYRNLKNTFDASHNNISFLANLRNFITHNTLEISTDGVEIFHPVNPNGTPARERFQRGEIDSIVKNIATGMLKNGSMYKLGDSVDEFKKKKGYIYCPMGKASEILDASNPENFLLYNRTAAIFAYNKLNAEMLANPDVKFADLLAGLLAEDDGTENSAFLKAEFTMMQNTDQLLANDSIQYASFVFSSKFFDEKFDYSGNDIGVEGFNAEDIGRVRHSLMHGYYSIEDDKITIKTLDDEGQRQLTEFRKQNRRRKNSPDQEIQEFVRNNRKYDQYLRDVCTISIDELVQICNGVIDIYKETHQDEYDMKSESEDEINSEEDVELGDE